MLFTFHVWRCETFFSGELTGSEGPADRCWVTFENLCNDWLAHRLCAGAETGRGRDDEAAKPADFEPQFDYAICRARGVARADGLSDKHARRICAAARTNSCRLAGDSRGDLHHAGRRILCVP